MTPEERANDVCNQWETPHIPRSESPRLDTLIAAAIRDAEATKAYNIKFTCPECDETQNMQETITGILSSIRDSGWPICPECGDDMDFDIG
jgi:rRNA maturation protein Nop10